MRKPVDITHLVSMLEQILDEYTAEPSRVLIVDDDETLSEHFRLVLTAAGMEISVVNQPEKVMGEIAVFRPNIVLLDMHMPGYSGSELATVIRYHEEWLGLPIVYLSAETDLDEQIMAMGKGADDFITKPISDTQLVAMVRGRARRSKQLNDLMSKDSLTGLLKHALIKEEINMAVNRARRSNTVLSVVMADIDLFKRVNDTYGHAAGDQVLRAIAHLLRQRLRKTDVIGRYGGEEFAAVLPDCDEATARGIMEDIRIRFASLRFQHEGEEFSCTFSAGIACSAGQQDCSANGLLGAADEALYRAKRGGRNQVCIANVTDKTIQG
jgi:diguanylate cyclase (GGDEF)-like protein